MEIFNSAANNVCQGWKKAASFRSMMPGQFPYYPVIRYPTPLNEIKETGWEN